MKTLKEFSTFDFEMFWDENREPWYRLREEVRYISHRYGDRTITCPKGMVSDGASGPAEDIISKSFFIHDRVRTTRKWDNGDKCTNRQASFVLRDILLKEGRYVRACTWWIATFCWGYIVEAAEYLER